MLTTCSLPNRMKKRKIAVISAEWFEIWAYTSRTLQSDSAFFAPMCSVLRSAQYCGKALSSWLVLLYMSCIEASDFYDTTNVRNESVRTCRSDKIGPDVRKVPETLCILSVLVNRIFPYCK